MQICRSHFCTSAFCMSAFCIALLMTRPVPRALESQGIGPVTFRDSLVMRQMVYRTPCPVPVPRAWSAGGQHPGASASMQPGGNRRSGDRAVPADQARPQPGSGDPWNPLCVRVVVGGIRDRPGLPGDWMVVFDLTVDRPGVRRHRPAVRQRRRGTASHGPPIGYASVHARRAKMPSSFLPLSQPQLPRSA